MSDQALTDGYLQQVFRSFARPDLDQIVEAREAEARERSQRWRVRWVSRSAEFLEGMHASLRDDVGRLEQRMDEVHVRLERNEARGVPLLIENARVKYERSIAARGRIEKYLVDLEGEVSRIHDAATEAAWRDQARDLRRRLDELAAPLGIVGRRLVRSLCASNRARSKRTCRDRSSGNLPAAGRSPLPADADVRSAVRP